MAENITIKCTNHCGFEVTGAEEFCTSLYEHHDHEDNPAITEGAHWYEHVFSFWGVIVILIAGSIAVALANHTSL